MASYNRTISNEMLITQATALRDSRLCNWPISQSETWEKASWSPLSEKTVLFSPRLALH